MQTQMVSNTEDDIQPFNLQNTRSRYIARYVYNKFTI